MLTKDLISWRSLGYRIQPSFIQSDDPYLLECASQMLSVYNPAAHLTRGEINQQLEILTQGNEEGRLVMGLRKLLEDNAQYTSPKEIDFPAEREKLFLQSSHLLQSGAYTDEADYRRQALQGSPLDGKNAKIYSDLPDNDLLISTRGMTPGDLLERYNVALVQGILLTANHIELELKKVTPAKLRQLFSIIRFQRLVAEATGTLDAEEACIKIVIDGPGSILDQARSYGLQLALVFPVICQLPQWKLKAQVNWNNKQRQLVLDETAHLVARLPFGCYVPEEIKVFQKQFSQNNLSWKIEELPPILKAKGGTLLIPDFAFTSSTGKTVYLELFHRWHASQLSKRLQQLAEKPEWPLVIGVDRAIANRPDLKELLETSSLFAERGFLYRDYPTCDKVLKAIEALK